MSWPVINPLSRYRMAKRAQASPNPPEWPKSIIPRQDAYWRSEANMAEGNPLLALERGEKVVTPPAIWFQGRGDILHDYKDPESSFAGNEPQRFVAAYRKAGGEITLEYIDMERHAGHSPDLSQTGDMFARMAAFVGRHVRVAYDGRVTIRSDGSDRLCERHQACRSVSRDFEFTTGFVWSRSRASVSDPYSGTSASARCGRADQWRT